ncbi:hypothetical protein KR038_001623, partial [Drosophila bunnanda]
IIVDIDIAGKVITAKVYVAEDNLLQGDLLLGQDLTTCAEVLLKFDRNLLEEFADIFSTGLQGIGMKNVVQAKIVIESGQVVFQVPYRVSEPKKDVVAKMVDELVERDIITPSTSEYAS